MIVLVGESGSGKSTIEKALWGKGLGKVVSYTTRPIREGETDGVNYHYITKEKFQKLKSEKFFAESTCYNGWCYGMENKDYGISSVAIVEPYGLRQLKKIKDLKIHSFYIQASQSERLICLAHRGGGTIEIFRRIISDQGVFQGISDEVDYVINGNLPVSESVEEILDKMRVYL